MLKKFAALLLLSMATASAFAQWTVRIPLKLDAHPKAN